MNKEANRDYLCAFPQEDGKWVYTEMYVPGFRTAWRITPTEHRVLVQYRCGMPSGWPT